MSSTFSEAFSSEQNKNVKATLPKSKNAGGPLSDLLVTTHSQFYKNSDENRIYAESMLTEPNARFVQTVHQFAMHPQTLPKNPKTRKLGAHPEYAKQYEIHKSK